MCAVRGMNRRCTGGTAHVDPRHPRSSLHSLSQRCHGQFAPAPGGWRLPVPASAVAGTICDLPSGRTGCHSCVMDPTCKAGGSSGSSLSPGTDGRRRRPPRRRARLGLLLGQFWTGQGALYWLGRGLRRGLGPSRWARRNWCWQGAAARVARLLHGAYCQADCQPLGLVPFRGDIGGRGRAVYLHRWTATDDVGWAGKS